MIHSTRLAQAVYWVGGQLSRIIVPRRTYALISADPIKFGPAEWRRGPIPLSITLLKLSMRLDPVHWDHWALQHDECHPTSCGVCDGGVCDEKDEEEEG